MGQGRHLFSWNDPQDMQNILERYLQPKSRYSRMDQVKFLEDSL